MIDNNGRKFLKLCKSTDQIIANGRLFNDQDGEFTFCCQRGLSVTDYLLLHVFDINTPKPCKILDWNHFSDHVVFLFGFSRKCSEKSNDVNANEKKKKKKKKNVF